MPDYDFIVSSGLKNKEYVILGNMRSSGIVRPEVEHRDLVRTSDFLTYVHRPPA